MRCGAEDWTARRTWDGKQEVYREGSEQSKDKGSLSIFLCAHEML